ncbi:MAG TPA: hypothetical protein VGG11_13850 [Xanthobacteraceae bacterium]|jgi:hypothetical protein
MTTTKIIGAIVAVLAVAVVGFFVVRAVSPAYGGVNAYQAGMYQYGNGTNGGGLTVGSGSPIYQVLKGTAALIMSSYTVAATSTVAADIAVSGIQPGDLVFGMFATSTALYGGWEVVSASASSTPGYATLRIVNDTGASAVIPASVASSTQYIIIR